MSRVLLLLLSCAVLAGPAGAIDFRTIDRTIKKEPRYAGTPSYCLLVFGPQAKERVWLVLDGDTLYVDRNGNGDLTDKGERFKLPPYQVRHLPSQFRSVAVGELAVGGRKLGQLEVTTTRLHPKLKPATDEEKKLAQQFRTLPGGTAVTLKITGLPVAAPATGKPYAKRITQLAGRDRQGYLGLATRPQDAPIVHFDGPLQMTLPDEEQALAHGKEDIDLNTAVGSPGLGRGTFAYLDYACQGDDKAEEVIPTDAHPVAEIVFPPKDPAGRPVRRQWVLKQRC
jgi:hypothetical protein